jgi:hypothetical protein
MVSALQGYKIERKTVVYEKKLSDLETIFSLEIDKDLRSSKYLYLQVSSTDLVEVKMGKPQKLVVACSGYANFTCVTEMATLVDEISGPEGFRLKVVVVRPDGSNLTSPVSFGVSVSDFVTLIAGAHQRIYFHNLAQVEAQIWIPPVEKTFKTRFQAKAYTQEQYSNLMIYVNFEKQDFPTEAYHDFQLQHLDSHRMASIVSRADGFFCDPKKFQKPCVYKLLLVGKLVSSASITIRPLGKVENIDTELTYVASSHRSSTICIKEEAPSISSTCPRRSTTRKTSKSL